MTMYAFRLPDIGEGVAEGEVVAWHVEPGQHVVENQEMVEVMTDKATVTIGAPRAGRIAQLNANVGERVKVGSVLVVIETSEAAAAERRESRPPPRPPESDTALSRFQAPAKRESVRPVGTVMEPPPRVVTKPEEPAAPKSEATVASAVGDLRESLPGAGFFSGKSGNGSNGHSTPAQKSGFFAERPLATPATRKLARDLGVDLRNVRPSGDGGRVTNDDVRSFSGGGGVASFQRSPLPSPLPRERGARRELEERTPFVGLRRRIAERMQMTKQKAAHFTFVEEVEVDELVEMVERLKPKAAELGVKVTYLPFIIKAVTLALKKHPILNSTLDEQKNELVYRRYYHIGVATATDQGLLVPVVRDADQKSPLEIAREIQRLAQAARDGKLSAQELSGSTFTITSLGKQAGFLATPVLNYPEVGILGVHRVKEKPVVRSGQIVIGQVMMLSLSMDHRIIDGHVGAAFAYDVMAYLENPSLLMLELT